MQSTDSDTPVLDAPLGSASRPTWRGLLHMIALITAIPLLVVLSILSNGARTRAAVIVYAVGLCSMLTVSTVYHRWVHSLRARAAWRRARPRVDLSRHRRLVDGAGAEHARHWRGDSRAHRDLDSHRRRRGRQADEVRARRSDRVSDVRGHGVGRAITRAGHLAPARTTSRCLGDRWRRGVHDWCRRLPTRLANPATDDILLPRGVARLHDCRSGPALRGRLDHCHVTINTLIRTPSTHERISHAEQIPTTPRW